MSERDFGRLSDEEFERFLMEGTSDIKVSEKVIKGVNPWKKSTDMIFAGLILQLFTLSFYYLDYLLPAAGMLLVLFGFRILSGENKWFRAGRAISFARCISWIISVISSCVLWLDRGVHEKFSLTMGYVNGALLMLIIGCIWGGFRQVQKKAGTPVHTLSLALLFFAYLLLIISARFLQEASLLVLILMAVFIGILICMRRIIREISASGYAVVPKLMKIPNFVLAAAFIILTVGGIIIGYTFFTSYPMDFEPVQAYAEGEVSDAKSQLLEKGFPEDVLKMMTDDDILRCKDSVRIVVQEPVTFENGERRWKDDLTLQTVMVQLQGDEETWKVIHGFWWNDALTGHQSDCVQFIPAYYDEGNYWAKSGEISGRVLYDKGDETFVSPYYSIEEGAIGKPAENNILYSFGGSGQGKKQVVAEFTLPAKAENCRGYIAYNTVNRGGAYIADSYFTYTHNGFTFPYKKASEYRWETTWISNDNTAIDQFWLVNADDIKRYDDRAYTIYE